MLFTLELLALEEVLVREVITIQEQPTAVEAYDKTGDLMEVQLQFNTPLESTFELYQNEPNPYHNSTTIKYFLPADDATTLVLRDEAGRVLQVIQQDGKAGLNDIQLKELTLPAGFIYYQLTTRFGTKSKKMLQLK